MVVSTRSGPASLPSNSSVGGRVRHLLAQRGWSLVTLADRSGVSHSALSLLTRGKVAYPKVETCEKLARAFDVPRSLLMPSTLDDGPSAVVVSTGVLLVPVVRPFAAAGGHLDTGELIPVPDSLGGQQPGTLAARITGGGLPPQVAVGALAIFHPDRTPRNRDPVIIDYQGSTHAAWYLEHQTAGGVEVIYRLHDGSTLTYTEARLAGVLLGAFNTPPRYNGGH